MTSFMNTANIKGGIVDVLVNRKTGLKPHKNLTYMMYKEKESGEEKCKYKYKLANVLF